MTANNDEVVHLPTKVFGFAHVATEIWDQTVGTEQTYKVCNGGLCIQYHVKNNIVIHSIHR